MDWKKFWREKSQIKLKFRLKIQYFFLQILHSSLSFSHPALGIFGAKIPTNKSSGKENSQRGIFLEIFFLSEPPNPEFSQENPQEFPPEELQPLNFSIL